MGPRLTVTNGQADEAFRDAGLTAAGDGPPEAPLTDLTSPISTRPAIGRSLLGPERFGALMRELGPRRPCGDGGEPRPRESPRRRFRTRLHP